jgi:VanZ family protein
VETILTTYKFVYQKFGVVSRRLFGSVAVSFFVLIVVKTLEPGGTAVSPYFSDKIAHFVAYFMLAAVSFPALPKIKTIWVLLGLCGVGVGLELAQGIMDLGRSMSFWDSVANAMGAVFALIVWMVISKFFTKTFV